MERARAVKTIEELMIQFERGIVEAECGDENAIEALDDSVEALESLRQGIKDIRVAMLYEDTGLTPDQVRELKERNVAKVPEGIQDAFGDGRLICPNCRNSVINYFNRSRPPQFCMICGQRLKFGE